MNTKLNATCGAGPNKLGAHFVQLYRREFLHFGGKNFQLFRVGLVSNQTWQFAESLNLGWVQWIDCDRAELLLSLELP